MSESSGENDNNSYPQGNVPQDKNWEWIACVYDMKRSTPESEITWNLSPSIMLTLPSEQNVQPKVDLIIESSKQFIYSEGLGWNWHKSWNIPDIHCTLDIRDPLTNEKLLPPSKIYAEIYVVRAVINQIHTFHLVDVGIKGGNRSEFDSSRCVFTGLKFDTTSYNHEGSKFHLVIVVYLNQNKFEHPKILESRISPPIFVDSRKSARDTQQQKAQKLSSFIDPFLPEQLDKKFVKRESKRKYNQDEPIDNNVEGLSNFFSAPNIRHKVKHPLFLAIKFSSCVKIYYNINIIPQNSNHEKFVEVMQKQLMEAYNRSSTNTNINIEEKPLILTIEHTLTQQSFKQKKINEFLEPLHGDVLHVMIDPVNIPKNFRKLEDIEGVKEAYKKVYPKISQQKFSQGCEDDDESSRGHKNSKVKVEKEGKKNYQSDDSDDEYQGANPSKKIKANDDQLQSVIDGKKLQIKNPAQQSEIVLNQSNQNTQQAKSMILQGAKPQKEKVTKGGEKAAPTKQAAEETPKATKGQRGKKGAKNAPPNPSEPTSMPSSQNLVSQSQLPTQVPSTSQFPQQSLNSALPPTQNMNASGSQPSATNPNMQWSQHSANPNIQKPPLNNSQQMYPGADLAAQQQIKPGTFPQAGQQGFGVQQYGAQQGAPINGQIADINGFDSSKPVNQPGMYNQQQYGQPTPGIQGGQQQLNGMQVPPARPGQQVAGYPQNQMGAHQQSVVAPGQGQGAYLNGSGQIPGQIQQPGMGGVAQNQYNQINKPGQVPQLGSKDSYEDPTVQARGAANPASLQGQFKQPAVAGTNATHLNQSQNYMGGVNPTGVAGPLNDPTGVVADPTDPTKQHPPHSQQAYNMGQPGLQQQGSQINQQYTQQQQYQHMQQRNGSQQLVQPQQQQQQQNRFMANQIGQQKVLTQGNQFYDQQHTNQFIQNNTEMNQYGNNNGYIQNPQGTQQYQIPQMGGQNFGNYYDDEVQQFDYQNNQYNRYNSASQGQFQFGQGQQAQNGQYNNYQNYQQGHQNLNNQYGYNQNAQQYNFQQNDQQFYLKQNVNPQFSQYYQQQQQQQVQQPNQQDLLNQGIQYNQMRAHSNSIPQQGYFKEDDYQ
ncbi:zinc finger transcription factor sma protein, putative (macronuclear) [Tetrahymena thermophila SB210]|uniref:Zinc finger transcription factor sma protein, putative n=1 Tax=Tetrahymena thermophila (strain SB210) TaxID=312017 RepID=Q23MG1_TETTS|nr:zinc finger transcription factor sma protein, putative [Tetrahymena thermophila SB210]EAR97678.2 zinc finger transcription factor sma protein, putative [Tetrahymena thermophila SB210]|eukprot:XP_001017923.2 zinc finger transcription factor sma protein, putative [Tetrahymena thermophila SB210]